MSLRQKQALHRKIDKTARDWEPAFEEAADQAFEKDRRALLAILNKAKKAALRLKATVNWSKVQRDWDAYFSQFAGEEWREEFMPMLEGVISDQTDTLNVAFGMQFDVRNLLAEAWFKDYTMTFAQPILETTHQDVSEMLRQAMENGWTIPEMEKQLNMTWEKYTDPDFTLEGRKLTDEELQWFTDRSPKYRRELIARDQTMRGSNAGSHHLYGAWEVEYKEWWATGDNRTRPTHLTAWATYSEGGSIGPIPINEPFIVGGFKLMYPGDGSLGAPLEIIIQCRCTELPYMEEFAEDWKPVELPPPLFPNDLVSRLETVQKLGGSTGAMLVRDPVTGYMYVLKRGASPEHIREEATADAVYRAMGIKVPEFKLYDTPQGVTKLAQYIEGTRSLKDVLATGGKREINKVLKQLKSGFVADSLLGNWDVLGLDLDNILVDKKGNVWRIDNGGALRYRAQGGGKGKAWSEHPMELWTLRDPSMNAQTAKIFGDLGWFDVTKQVGSAYRKRKEITAALPPDLQEIVMKRLEAMRSLTKATKAMKNDDWKEDYIDQFSRQRIGLRAAGVIDELPAKLTHRGVRVYDENGVEWDELRGANSVITSLSNYMGNNGGDYGMISYWMGQQAGSSWSSASQAAKYNIVNQRGVNPDNYYWHEGYDVAREHYKRTVTKLGETKYQTTWQMWHAFNYETMQNVRFTRNKIPQGYVEIVRTEGMGIMHHYGLSPGDKDVTMKRGACESGSIYQTVTVAGEELTLQKVPHHRIMGMYMYERFPGSGSTAFYGDRENEFVFIPEGIPFDYYGSVNAGEPTAQYWKKK